MEKKIVMVPLDINYIIDFMERTKEESWIKDRVKDENGGNCFFGHLFDCGGSYFYHMFEEIFATEYMIFPVNDGQNANYPQETPKQRVIAYLKDLRDGKAKTTHQLMDEEYNDYKKEHLPKVSSVILDKSH